MSNRNTLLPVLRINTSFLRMVALWLCLFPATAALAWGNEGHRIVALIAQPLLTPATRARVDAILATDRGDLTRHDMASAATWADIYKYQNRSADPYGLAHGALWHYVNLEIDDPDMDWACWNHPALPAGTPASAGAGHDCIVDKINQFERELASPTTSAPERLLALKYLLHLVGDIHQPLHAADNHDRGGNKVRVSGITHRSTSLHHAWDTVFVRQLGKNAHQVAARLSARISNDQRHQWQRGTPADWAWATWRIAKSQAYGELPHPDERHLQHLDSAYIDQARATVAEQLSKAGVRLAWLLNRALDQ